MTVFGRAIDGQEIFALVSLLTLLAFWLFVLQRERIYLRWFQQWESDRQARRSSDGKKGKDGAPPAPRGPWG